MTDFLAFFAFLAFMFWVVTQINITGEKQSCHSLCEKKGYDYGILFKNNSCRCDHFDENTFYMPQEK